MLDISFIIELLKSALYGIVEGITEWLPISSTGHMLLLNEFVALNTSKDFWDMFLVVIQLGAILSVLVLFFHKLNPFSPKKDAREKKQTLSLWIKVILACLPAAIIGIPIDNWIETNLSSPFIIAAALIIYGVWFFIIETRKQSESAEHTGKHFKGASEGSTELARVNTLEDLDLKTAMGIGFFQVLSIIPGTSRSGSTIIGGLILGCSRTVAAEFTFFLAIPVMFGASTLRIVKYFLKGNAFSSSEVLILLVGCAVAFLVSLLAIRFLMSFVKKHDFKVFGIYRIILGVLVIAYFTFQLIA